MKPDANGLFPDDYSNQTIQTSLGKFRIERWLKPNGYPWIRIIWPNGEVSPWVPSLADLYRIDNSIAAVEDEKYRREAGKLGFEKYFAFRYEQMFAYASGQGFNYLSDRHQLPERRNGIVTNSHGANVN